MSTYQQPSSDAKRSVKTRPFGSAGARKDTAAKASEMPVSLTAWFGSANLTGAGMGAKSDKKRNFENGVLSDDPALVEPLVEQFDSVWRGAFCRDCGRRDFCGDPVV